MLEGQLGDLLDLRPLDNHARGVAGAVEDKDFGFGRDGAAHHVGRELEMIGTSVDGFDHSLGHHHHIGSNYPVRRRTSTSSPGFEKWP